MRKSVILKSLLLVLVSCGWVCSQNDEPDASKSAEELAKLPGGTNAIIGHLESSPYEMNEGPDCDKGMIVVPENRRAEKSRAIKLYFYRFKARQPSNRSPVFMVPGGPGGFYNDNWVNGLRKQPTRGSNLEAWIYSRDRDVVLVNQRGARLPDRSFMMFGFMFGGISLDNVVFSRRGIQVHAGWRQAVHCVSIQTRYGSGRI